MKIKKVTEEIIEVTKFPVYTTNKEKSGMLKIIDNDNAVEMSFMYQPVISTWRNINDFEHELAEYPIETTEEEWNKMIEIFSKTLDEWKSHQINEIKSKYSDELKKMYALKK